MMTCAEVENLAPFYVVGALGNEDTAEIDTHLAFCSKHEETISQLEAAARLPEHEGFDMAVAPEVKAKLMDAIRPNRGRLTGSNHAIPATLENPLILGATAAAIMLFAVAGIVAWSIANRAEPEHGAFAITLTGDGGASGTLYYVYGQNTGVISVEGLPKLPGQETYQVWASLDIGALSCGLLVITDGSPTLARMEGKVSSDQHIFVTIEPPGGSLQPTGPTVLRDTMKR